MDDITRHARVAGALAATIVLASAMLGLWTPYGRFLPPGALARVALLATAVAVAAGLWWSHAERARRRAAAQREATHHALTALVDVLASAAATMAAALNDGTERPIASPATVGFRRDAAATLTEHGRPGSWELALRVGLTLLLADGRPIGAGLAVGGDVATVLHHGIGMDADRGTLIVIRVRPELYLATLGTLEGRDFTVTAVHPVDREGAQALGVDVR